MRSRMSAAAYSVVVGVSIICLWTTLCASDSIPELETQPYFITMHIIAELVTAVMLLLGALGLLREAGWASMVYFLSMGMLVYTLIMSPGYYMDSGDWELVAMFETLLAIAALLLGVALLRRGWSIDGRGTVP